MDCKYLVSRLSEVTDHTLPPHSARSCHFWVGYFQTITSIGELFVAEIILVFRLWAIYRQSRNILIGVLSLFLLSAVATVTVLAIQSKHAVGTNHPLPGIYICILTAKLNILYAVWIPVVVFEGVAFLLVASKAFMHLKHAGDVGAKSIMGVIFRDSFLYFLAIYAISLTNAMIYKFGQVNSIHSLMVKSLGKILTSGIDAQPGLYNIPQGPSSALISITTSRMLLNLRQKAKQDAEIFAKEMSTLRFGSRRVPQSEDVSAADSTPNAISS
ncbi:hypothetical protein EW146_g9365 [Bondarzewia mesenterica]|uniref:G-protein coupled receptors family 1 profile domain-containing protein n=1 Tax=Bondarzewia mesenterica TaxID=1095465 RepID=A0A4V3XCV8_9AGAM|nr:hypothetical protein EW146_g9365 [Bondarzewia mesenterica]